MRRIVIMFLALSLSTSLPAIAAQGNIQEYLKKRRENPPQGIGVSQGAVKATFQKLSFSFKQELEDRTRKGWFEVTGYSKDLYSTVSIRGPRANITGVDLNVISKEGNATNAEELVVYCHTLLRTVFPKDFEKSLKPWFDKNLNKAAAGQEVTLRIRSVLVSMKAWGVENGALTVSVEGLSKGE